MKIALISTPTRTYTSNYIMPLGIMYLASYLEHFGHAVEIIDVARTRQRNQSIAVALKKIKPDLIGISGIITAYRFAKELIIDLKKAFPDVPLVVGGHIVLDISDLLISGAGCDYTISGYGEKSLEMLVRCLEKGRDVEEVPGLTYLKGGKIIQNRDSVFFDRMDDIPLPAYDHIDMEHYVTAFKKMPKLEQYLKKTGKPAPPMRWAYVIAGRGCTDKCSFCVHEFGRKGLQTHSINYIINNIKFLYENYGVRIVKLGEDLFLYNAKQAREFVSAMNNNFPDVYFSCSSRADFLTEEMMDILKESNCYSVNYGFESGSNEILKILNKRMTRDANIAAYKNISRTNIVPACSIMVGTPGETRKTISETIDAIKAANIVDSAVFVTTPYPGCRLYRWAVEQKIIKDVDAYLNSVSNRDAFKLSINFTSFPNLIILMMRVLVFNALEKNKENSNKRYKISFNRLIIRHWMIPMLYEIYFFTRKVLSFVFKKYSNETIVLNLNKAATVKISTDKE